MRVCIDPGHVALVMRPVSCENRRTRIGAPTPTRALTTITLSEATMAAPILPACARCGKPCKSTRARYCSARCKNESESVVLRAIEKDGHSVGQWLARHYYAEGCNLSTAGALLGVDKRTLWAFLTRNGLATKAQSESQFGELNPFHGRTHSAESKERIAEASKERQPRLRRSETKQYGDGPALRGRASPLFRHGVKAYRALALAEFGAICEDCGGSSRARTIDVHHKDENRLNNDLSNLVVLCRSCHRKRHQRR